MSGLAAVPVNGLVNTSTAITAQSSTNPPLSVPIAAVTLSAPAPTAVQSAAPAPSGGGGRKKRKMGENTGRWTAEEHRLFLQGLEQHGKGWKKIASLIKSRTVVQIRTHAQKYFQKLAKARQNGEEGDVAMEGRGGVPSIELASAHASMPKRRRLATGTRRKPIQSVVASVIKKGKPAVSPVLAPFVLPTLSNIPLEGPIPPLSESTMSAQALEDSLFRFFTPAPVNMSEQPVSEIARQAGANPISVPSGNGNNKAPSPGEASPTGVAELYPSWTDSKDIPTWYGKGADVDALLDVADTLDWIADSGDVNETYTAELSQVTSVTSLPNVDENAESVVPPLPSIFDGAPGDEEQLKEVIPKQEPLDTDSLLVPEGDDIDDQLFETAMDEHDFVSTILEDGDPDAPEDANTEVSVKMETS